MKLPSAEGEEMVSFGVMSEFEVELKNLLNSHSKDAETDTPDFILAKFLQDCLLAFNNATISRDEWHGDDLESLTTGGKVDAKV